MSHPLQNIWQFLGVVPGPNPDFVTTSTIRDPKSGLYVGLEEVRPRAFYRVQVPNHLLAHQPGVSAQVGQGRV